MTMTSKELKSAIGAQVYSKLSELRDWKFHDGTIIHNVSMIKDTLVQIHIRPPVGGPIFIEVLTKEAF